MNAREEAKLLGAKHYVSAAPCKHGHGPSRYVLTNKCVACEKARVEKWNVKNPGRAQERSAASALANKEQVRDYLKAYRARNKQEAQEYGKSWRAVNKDAIQTARIAWRKNSPDKVRASGKRWQAKTVEQRAAWAKRYAKENPHVGRLSASNRRAAKLRATPSWVNRDAVRKIYKRAVSLGMHVDHVVPLQGKLVCGLHVEANLQLLTPEANMKKGIKFEVG